MASSFCYPPSGSPLPLIDNSTSKFSFLHGTKFSSRGPSRAMQRVSVRGFRSPSAMSLNHIPKQFREENLKDGLMDNYKNVPQYLYGLTPSQIDMFMTEDNPVQRQAETITEESISSAKNYLDNGGMWSFSGMGDQGPVRCSMSARMYGGGAGGYGRPKSEPPDLPSLLLDSRIVYLGMPITPEVTELLIAEFLWLGYDNPSKPIYLYINSPGTQDVNKQIVGSETEAYAIADAMGFMNTEVHTVNVGMAYGQAAMLLSLGAKGHRSVLPNAFTKLYLPRVAGSSGASTDMWIRAKELEVNTDYYLDLLEKGTGKSKEELSKEIQLSKCFQGQEAIDYGLADKIVNKEHQKFDKHNFDESLAQSRATRIQAGGPSQAAASGFR
ncbi:hypothetical protein QN277_001314 [Acacia crassicarpa]|uniref:ATP-dependent Clp protease proteolytic subunit n=1 Tax=Acacia crassicarpa TaxID=499986 RepID=A0AAE1N8G0_9FABA|nr:hypothetical protein QN277_001314 [Acacia crassicarpa]